MQGQFDKEKNKYQSQSSSNKCDDVKMMEVWGNQSQMRAHQGINSEGKVNIYRQKNEAALYLTSYVEH